jgi:hypothetical protein
VKKRSRPSRQTQQAENPNHQESRDAINDTKPAMMFQLKKYEDGSLAEETSLTIYKEARCVMN